MLPCMCGRQTLTIVVSSPCMTQAQMTVAVVKPRLGTVAAASDLIASPQHTKKLRLHDQPARESACSLGPGITSAESAEEDGNDLICHDRDRFSADFKRPGRRIELAGIRPDR